MGDACEAQTTLTSEQSDVDYEMSKYQHYKDSRRDSETVELSLPRKTLLRDTAELATRCHLSHRTATAMTAQILKLGGGDLDDFSLSTATSLRQLQSCEGWWTEIPSDDAYAPCATLGRKGCEV